MRESKSLALPLGDTPIKRHLLYYHKFWTVSREIRKFFPFFEVFEVNEGVCRAFYEVLRFFDKKHTICLKADAVYVII